MSDTPGFTGPDGANGTGSNGLGFDASRFGFDTPDEVTERVPTGPARILVADDEEDIRDFVEIKLRSAGMDVVTAENGDEALRILSSDTDLDLAVLDVMMPGMTGIEVLREVRARGASKDVPVILLTAKARESDVELGYAVGTTDYLTKPFSPMELLLRIKATLGHVG